MIGLSPLQISLDLPDSHLKLFLISRLPLIAPFGLFYHLQPRVYPKTPWLASTSALGRSTVTTEQFRFDVKENIVTVTELGLVLEGWLIANRASHGLSGFRVIGFINQPLVGIVVSNLSGTSSFGVL